MTDVEKPPRDISDHGGASDIQDAWRILAGGAPVAARALRSIASDPEAPAAARVTASQTILKMVGFGQDEVKLRIVPQEYDQAAPTAAFAATSAEIIDRRLAELAAPPVVAPEDDIIDAVIVEQEA